MREKYCINSKAISSSSSNTFILILMLRGLEKNSFKLEVNLRPTKKFIHCILYGCVYLVIGGRGDNFGLWKGVFKWRFSY